jgi:Methyltransferase domain
MNFDFHFWIGSRADEFSPLVLFVDDTTMSSTKVSGILFSRSVRSSFASLTLATSRPQQLHQHQHPTSSVTRIRIQFPHNSDGDVLALRSFCRKHYKLGDHIELFGGRWKRSGVNDNNNETCCWNQRWVVDVDSVPDAKAAVQVLDSQVWNMRQCQEYQNKYLPTKKQVIESRNNVKIQTATLHREYDPTSAHHGGGKDKRLQAETMVDFFLQAMQDKMSKQHDNASLQQQRSLESVCKYLNQGSGVLDIAGGSGYVSMALALRGVQSTVIDARSSVGKLPGKDRKFWKRKLQQQALQKYQNDHTTTTGLSVSKTYDRTMDYDYCQPTIVPFKSHRAWFGTKPPGVDQSFRHPDEEELATISLEEDDNSELLLRQASALVALHPDEATADIVRAAVQHRTPFMVVPCCVFARLFPNRRRKDGSPVHTYQDLLEYLQEMDESIQQTTLPLEGRNIALWSMF